MLASALTCQLLPYGAFRELDEMKGTQPGCKNRYYLLCPGMIYTWQIHLFFYCE